MDCARNIITANFSGGGTSATTAPLWQWDYGQALCITGIDLPAAFEVHFSTNRTGGVSTVAVGADGQVTIPNGLLTIGKNLNAWIYLSDARGEGETEYSILIPVKARPMPETYDAEVTGEFDDVVRQVSEYAETARTAADNAGASASAAATSASEAAASASAAESAKTAAETAQGNVEDAQAAAETAAQTATQKAEQTAQDAAQAAQSKADAESAADRAEAAQTGAESAKTDAETAAQGAADSASAASASATSAGQAATSAGQSAIAAAGSATTAGNAAQTATTKAAEASASADAAAASETAAQTAQTAAETAATNAGQSASTATTKAAEAAQSASNAAASETAAEAAATRAETAAASLVVDDALSETSENPVQNKVITGEVTQLKNALNKFYSEETETGTIFRFSESDGVLKVVSDSEVTVGNQNILDTPLLNYNEHTVSGLTYQKQANGSVRISGTATDNTNIWLNQTAKFPQGTYTLSGCPSGGSRSTYRMICNYRISGVDYTWLIDTGNGATAELTADMDNVRCTITIFSGATVDLTFYPQLEYASTKSEYATCANETVSANTEISIDGIKTIFANTAFNLTASKYGWTDDILNVQNEVNALSDSVDEAEETVALIDGLLTENVQHFSIDDYSLICIHHDNFSRTMTGWEIGMNAGGGDTGNNYEWVTASTYDDGLRVDEGATFEANSSRTNPFSLRKIANAHSADFAFETNAPTIGKPVCFGYNVTDIKNFILVTITKNSNGFSMGIIKIKNGSYDELITRTDIYKIVGNVCAFYVVKGWLYFYLDDQLAHSVYVGDMGTYLYMASYKGYETHFDFVNVFNLANKVEWNPNHVLDTGVSNIPLITTSANDGGYTLQEDNTRWSNYADKFLLNSTDPLVHNGRRSERSVANLSGYTGNLRHLKVSFDVYFPSTSIDAEQSDIMMQMHDRDGTYRGFVPFILGFYNNKIRITLASTHAPKDGADDVVKWVEGAEIASITTDEWHRFELEIKERYDENQNPFVKISIDSKLVFESHKPNCFNDLLGSSPQYGIYKNLWGTGVTTFERYFDNFKIEY